MLRTVNGYATEMAEPYAKRPEEPLLLHEEVSLNALGTRVEKSDNKVPVAGMWSKTEYILFGVVHFYMSGPPHALIQQCLANALQKTHCVCLCLYLI